MTTTISGMPGYVTDAAVTAAIPVVLTLPSETTYASTATQGGDNASTGVILLQDLPQEDERVISPTAIKVLVHLALMGVCLALLGLVWATSVLSPDSILASMPAVVGLCALAFMTFVSILAEPAYRYAIFGLAYVGGLVAFMAIGGLYNDAVFFGKVYMGVVVLLAIVAGIQWLQARHAPHSRRPRLS